MDEEVVSEVSEVSPDQPPGAPPRVITVVWTAVADSTAVWEVIDGLVARWDLLPAQGADVGVWFAARGPCRLWGGEVPFIDQLVQRLTATGVTELGVAVAPGRLLSWALAHEGRRRHEPLLLCDDRAAEVRACLGVAVLCRPGSPAGLPVDLVDRLKRLGLGRLGDVIAIRRADLIGRFGEPGLLLHRWASGDEPPFSARVPPTPISVDSEFVPPVAHLDAVLFAGRRLADELDQTLSRRGEVATVVRIDIDTEHGEHVQRLWSHAEGLRPGALVDRVAWQLKGWTAGPVALLRFAVIEVAAQRGHQSGWWGGEAHGDDRAARAVARVVGLLGDDAAGQLVCQGGRDPVDRYRRHPVSTERVPARVAHPTTASGAPWPGAAPPPSPARVWRQPLSIDLLDDAGGSVVVSARGVLSASPHQLVIADGTRCDIVAWAGPWPLDERWWQPGAHRRQARLQLVTDDGAALLVFRQQQRWWLRASYR
jgi:protein ImuB